MTELNQNKNNFKKYKKYFIVLLLFLIPYIALLLWATKLQMISTFPWYKVQNENQSIDKILKFDYEEINIDDWFWNNINWLYVDSWIDKSKTVYFFHWNGWPIYYFYNWINYIADFGYNVIVYDYPWYWKSDWIPYKNNITSYSQKFYDYIKKEKNIKNEDLIIWWYSIWTAAWVDFASKNDFDKVLLFSPISSRYDAARHYLWFAVQKLFFMSDSFVNYNLVKNINNDALIVHWTEDWIIPFWHWKKVFENYSWNKYFIQINKQGHNNILENNWDYLKIFIKDFLNWNDLWREIILDNDLKILLQKRIDLEKFLSRVDIISDESIQKFVNSDISFDNKSYIPKDLVNIAWDYIFDAKWWNQKLRKEANDNLQKMSNHFYKDFWEKIVVVSAYRSYNYQKGIKDRWCPDNLCAKAWYSEHQSWLVVDLWEASTKYSWDNNKKLGSYYGWLDKNAHKYWFHNTYQKWLQVDWYEIEPWHWRYLWEELATYLKTSDLTFAEFYNNLTNK